MRQDDLEFDSFRVWIITYHFDFSLYSTLTYSVRSGEPLGLQVTDEVHPGAGDAAPPPDGVRLGDGQHHLVEVDPHHLQPLLHQHTALVWALDLEAGLEQRDSNITDLIKCCLCCLCLGHVANCIISRPRCREAITFEALKVS